MPELSAELLHELEAIEIEAWGDWFRAASPSTASMCGLSMRPVAGGILGAASADVLALNRVIGFGHGVEATRSDVDAIVDAYVANGASRFFVQVGPTARPVGVESFLTDRGFRHYNNWIKLYRDDSPPPEARTELKIREVGPDEALRFGKISSGCFEWPEETARWVADTAGRPGWRHYMAYDGNDAAATGAFFIAGSSGWLDFAATLPGHRGRGAQSALLERRIRDATAAGCRTLVVETAEQTETRSSPSWRNTLAFGFREAYVRPNYILTLPD
jgi:GNAT superfamily N-acetyltransferase